MAWILLASVFLGTFALPAKYVKNYAWENTWGAFFFFAMLIVPVGFAALALKGLGATYAQVSGGTLLGVIALGFLWGCGFCLWGHGLARLGLSLGYALTMGTMALCGSILPFFLGQADRVATRGGLVVILGILICIAGVALNGVAGMKRERSLTSPPAAGASPAPKKNTLTGVIICVLAGLFSSGCNIAYHIGGNLGHIDRIAIDQFHNPPWLAGIAVWTLIFGGGLVSSFGFAILRLAQNRTWKNFALPGTGLNLFLTLLMALGHFACLFFYGLGGWMLGALGTSVGFAIFQSGSVLIGNALGFMTGEWKGASAESRRWLAGGLTVLIAGIVLVSVGNTLQ
ncbi:MAG TPA: L-rhamnose/proton symporter RhaT [Opitutaceae bacterium]|nr:L-rhamnose/proton symporter RhaT [Opitutaceae bacterium]